ncbi:MAG: Spy/CpxP family protein refolding chaperone [Thalassobaculum sp.]|uniref:Spy/CpxP family protein refolding chaperone n=1 Tax=Thalassobaculum sp. TaxID=2022740 RepID=UPI0032EF8E26
MTSFLRATLPALALLAAASVAQAQTPQQNTQAHHPAAPAPGMGAGIGMDRGGMMGMMGGAMGPGMMQQMHGGPGGMPMMGMMRGGMGMPFEHVEGRIAFLKAEIGITEAQQPAWDALAAALRRNAEAMRSMHQRMAERMQPAAKPWPDRIEGMAGMLAARAEALKAVEMAARPLYDALTDEQRGKADALFAGPMGMM